MKKAVLALILLSLLISLAGCSSKQKKAEEEAMQYALQMSYDSVAADIDGDGLVEDCYLSHGTTSGVLTVVITAVANDTVKYRNTFYLNTSRFPRFSMEEGVLRLRLERHNYATDEQTVECTAGSMRTENGLSWRDSGIREKVIGAALSGTGIWTRTKPRIGFLDGAVARRAAVTYHRPGLSLSHRAAAHPVAMTP